MTQIELTTLNAIKAYCNKKMSIDWEQRRYELVKELLPTMIERNSDATEEEIINLTIDAADKIIATLKNK